MSRSLMFGSEEASGPKGHRAYAIGDIHGRLDLLDELLDKVAVDNAARPPAKTTIVFLGDLIDRGPQSAEVIERLRTYRPNFAKTVFLMGNHEEVLLRVIAGEMEVLPDWLKFGGAQCVQSYGIDPMELQSRDAAGALKMLKRAIPREHLKFIGSFADTASFGRYLLVHAGVRPGIPLSDQLPQDLRWIRAPFLDDATDHGRVVVHGHTICEDVEVRRNRIGIDTGAYSSGILTALGLEKSDRWLLQTGREPAVEAEPARVANLSHA